MTKKYLSVRYGLEPVRAERYVATTNIAIKAAYSLLDLRCNRLEMNIRRFLRKIVRIVVDEINEQNGTVYQAEDVRFEFVHEIMSNEQENAQNEKTEAEKQQVQINTFLSLANVLDDETVIQAICEILDIDYEEIKDKLPEDEAGSIKNAEQILNRVIPEDKGGGVIEQTAEGSAAGTS